MDRQKPQNDFRHSLHGLAYDDTVAGKPPVHVKTSNSPQRVDSNDGSVPPLPPTFVSAKSKLHKDNDWAQTSSSLRDSSTSLNTEVHSVSSRTSAPSVPQIRVESDHAPKPNNEKPRVPLRPKKSKDSGVKSVEPFLGLALSLPGGALSEEIPTDNIEFSKRGSMLIDGHKVNSAAGNGLKPRTRSQRITPNTNRAQNAKVLSMEEETLSQKVRSFYEAGTDAPEDPEASSALGRKIGLRWQDALNGAESQSTISVSRATSTTDLHSEKSATGSTRRDSMIARELTELAGGLEDWQDVENGDVDRYGFIMPRSPTSDSTSQNGAPTTPTKEPHHLQRVSTSLQLASETPRRKGTIRRTPTQTSRRYSASDTGGSNSRPGSAQRPHTANLSHRESSVRHAAYKFNKTRRLRDEASDMLTLPSIPQGTLGGTPSDREVRARRKETEREEKWRKMARVISNQSGGGMVFDFDTHSPKLIERTWKGIPDRWRATAWHAFLSTSAQKRPDSPTDDDLINQFHEYMPQSSPDDVQIDIDVPRTISSHIMFRRRYRGGQRLLFRVLHAMSLHFPETGYVQGMATLAATLLAYYDEERAFVMLVRLWDLRGLDKLYQSGFGGLMQALDDFEKHWLGRGELATKLTDLGIGPTAYGTRWYLTLFNYSIPFPAQLRVWDVFMLLGSDDSPTQSTATGPSMFGTTLDVLHATSAALIDGMRDILLDSDFENGMKVLTSWIPIKDEDLFMRVAKVEWKMHRRKV